MGEIANLLAAGLLQALEPLNLGMILAGCMAGLFIGAMPGLGSVNGVAILLPVTFLVPPTAAIIFLLWSMPPALNKMWPICAPT